MTISAETIASIESVHVAPLFITRFATVKNFEINALQGAYILEDAGVAGGWDVRVARTMGGKVSKSGKTAWPALIEAGWVPGFRADQLPNPSDSLLEGKGRFVVFPVSETGFGDYQAYVVEMAEYTQAWNKWYEWRNDEFAVVSPEKELAAKGLPMDVIRLARNVTRAWPGADTRGVKWTVREAMDLVDYHSGWIAEESGGTIIVYCPDRSVVVYCAGGFSFPEDACRAYGLCSVVVELGDEKVTELLIYSTEEESWQDTLFIKIWRDNEWALIRVEELMFRTGSPFPGAACWPKWVAHDRAARARAASFSFSNNLEEVSDQEIF